ncbi:DapH/DapD/GlmU-related protein [Paraburkholderia sp. 40]|uniref:DapH/DapD/GlmU-related protein n=1 Tax=Paraburkholderia sp. 40 TaxID=2991059 RepID=UPI003D23A0A5
MSRKIVVFGISPFSRMVCSLFADSGADTVVRTAHQRFIPQDEHGDLPFVPFETLPQSHPPHEYEVFVALEHARQNIARAEIAETARQQGYRLASYVSPSAQLGARVVIGEHSLVLEGAIAQYDVRIGNNVIVGARCFFGQGTEIGENAYFGSAVFVDRFSKIGRHCTIGSQVRIAESVKVPAWSYLKAFEDVHSSLTEPVFIHEALRASGRIVDRRLAAGKEGI